MKWCIVTELFIFLVSDIALIKLFSNLFLLFHFFLDSSLFQKDFLRNLCILFGLRFGCCFTFGLTFLNVFIQFCWTLFNQSLNFRVFLQFKFVHIWEHIYAVNSNLKEDLVVSFSFLDIHHFLLDLGGNLGAYRHCVNHMHLERKLVHFIESGELDDLFARQRL